jgi:hypothetical protein
MKKTLFKTAIAPILAMLIIGLLPLSMVNAVSTEAYVSPTHVVFDTSTASLGKRFNVTVWVGPNIEMMKAWQVKIGYNVSVINVTRWFEPTWNSSYVFYGMTTLPVPAPTKPSYGYVSSTEAWMGCGSALFPAPPVPGGFNGTGLLCIVEFEVKQLPGKFETLTSLFKIDYTGDTFWIKNGESSKRAFEIYTNGDYQITWVLPPSPHFAVEPTPVSTWPLTFGPWENVIGKRFNVTAYIAGLDPAWGVTSASFHLQYNTTLINVTRYWVDALWTTSSVTYIPGGTGVFDELDVSVGTPSGTPGGAKVNMILIEFEILFQGTVPPRAAGAFDKTPIEFVYTFLMNHVFEIPTTAPTDGEVKILCLMTLPLGWLEVIDPLDGDHEVDIGPEPSIGKEFDVNVIIKNLHPEWHMIAYQFRLCFDDHLLEGVSITFGPFMSDSRWDKYGLLNISRFDPQTVGYPPCAVAGQILWPNPSGQYTAPFPQAPGPNVTDLNPPVNPLLATIRFRVLQQITSWPPISLTCALDLRDQTYDDKYFLGVDPVTQVKSWIPNEEPVDGVCNIIGTPAIGRVIDVYGGIEGEDPFPAPYGGQGLNQPMDMVYPQKLVILYVNVTYNYWPVQNKVVALEIESIVSELPFLLKGTALTDENGVARFTFRMPWQCFDAEKYFGLYKVTATVDVACVVINDTTEFHYDYLVEIFKVTTDKFYYLHNEDVGITVTYGSHALRPQRYPAEFWVYISDELGQPIGYDVETTTIGDGTFCQYTNHTLRFIIHIPKWAFSGYAKVHVNCYSFNPTEGGWAWCPEYTCPPPCPQSPEPYPTIYILPDAMP